MTKENLLKQTRKKRRNQKQLSMADAMVQEAQILDQQEREAARLNDERQREITRLNDQRERDLARDNREIQQLQFQAEMRQRDQHHELAMLRQQAIINQGQAVIDQGKERLLRLWVNLQRQMNHLYIPHQNASLGAQEEVEEDSQLGIDLNDLQEDH